LYPRVFVEANRRDEKRREKQKPNGGENEGERHKLDLTPAAQEKKKN